MKNPANGHTLHAYDADLAQLRGVVLEMGELVIEQVTNAVKALCEMDAHLGRSVAGRDREIDQLDIEATEETENLFALRQPVASDLRMVLGFSKVVSELARAGNKAKKIANFAVQLGEDESRTPNKRLLHHVRTMEQRACCMLERSLDALARLDVETAVGIIQEDDELDGEFDAGMRHLVTFMWENPGALTKVLDMVFALKALERIGDHANHIAQQVIFIAKGKDVRYVNAEVIASEFVDS